MSMSFLVAADAKTYEILRQIVAQAAPGLNVMDLKAFDRSARLAPPPVSLQDFTAELAVDLSLKLQTWPSGSNSLGFHEYSRRVGRAAAAAGRAPAE